jgi:hypothetical protein
MSQTTLPSFEQAANVQAIITQATPQSWAGVAYGEDSRALSVALKTALKSQGFQVKSVRAGYRCGCRRLKIVLHRGPKQWNTFWEEDVWPVEAAAESVLQRKVPFEVAWA